MNTQKYNRSAYRCAVWKEAGRLLRERYFPEEGLAPPLVCTHVFRASTDVPLDIVQEVIIALAKAERAEQDTMDKFGLEEVADGDIRVLDTGADSPPTLGGSSNAARSTAKDERPVRKRRPK